MKLVTGFLIAAYLLSGCQTMGGPISHDDGEAVVDHDSGPTLCHDGTPPPCTIRD